MAEVTVVFADLTGSTGVFESLGNAKATQAITRLTQWIGIICTSHSGQIVKYLGDGVLMVFNNNLAAIETAIELHHVHANRIQKWPEALKMRLKIGMARGEVVMQDGDCFGDAVNVASRLSDLSGPEQILTTDAVIDQLPENSAVRYRSLGAMALRGRQEACMVYRIEWQNEVLSEYLTQPASLAPQLFARAAPAPLSITLTWLDQTASFTAEQLPVYLGRDLDCEFVVQDPRVSRQHAKLEWRANRFHLEDVSSYGTGVRFTDNAAIVNLRRQECVLPFEGEIAMGGPFQDFTVPMVTFQFTGQSEVPRKT